MKVGDGCLESFELGGVRGLGSGPGHLDVCADVGAGIYAYVLCECPFPGEALLSRCVLELFDLVGLSHICFACVGGKVLPVEGGGHER